MQLLLIMNIFLQHHHQHHLPVFIILFFFFFVEMECLLCYFQSDVSKLKEHYQNYHCIDPKDEKFLNLFKPDYLEDDKCIDCSIVFLSSRKKNQMFLKHYKQQTGGSRNNVNAPLNILKKRHNYVLFCDL